MNLRIGLLIFTMSIFSFESAVATDEWSSSYNFPYSNTKALRLQQADLIKKGESDYYNELGKTTQNIGEINTYNQEGLFNTVDAADGATVNSKLVQTTTIGAQNNSTTTISNSGNGTIQVGNGANAENSDGSVFIDEK